MRKYIGLGLMLTLIVASCHASGGAPGSGNGCSPGSNRASGNGCPTGGGSPGVTPTPTATPLHLLIECEDGLYGAASIPPSTVSTNCNYPLDEVIANATPKSIIDCPRPTGAATPVPAYGCHSIWYVDYTKVDTGSQFGNSTIGLTSTSNGCASTGNDSDMFMHTTPAPASTGNRMIPKPTNATVIAGSFKSGCFTNFWIASMTGAVVGGVNGCCLSNLAGDLLWGVFSDTYHSTIINTSSPKGCSGAPCTTSVEWSNDSAYQGAETAFHNALVHSVAPTSQPIYVIANGLDDGINNTNSASCQNPGPRYGAPTVVVAGNIEDFLEEFDGPPRFIQPGFIKSAVNCASVNNSFGMTEWSWPPRTTAPLGATRTFFIAGVLLGYVPDRTIAAESLDPRPNATGIDSWPEEQIVPVGQSDVNGVLSPYVAGNGNGSGCPNTGPTPSTDTEGIVDYLAGCGVNDQGFKDGIYVRTWADYEVAGVDQAGPLGVVFNATTSNFNCTNAMLNNRTFTHYLTLPDTGLDIINGGVLVTSAFNCTGGPFVFNADTAYVLLK